MTILQRLLVITATLGAASTSTRHVHAFTTSPAGLKTRTRRTVASSSLPPLSPPLSPPQSLLVPSPSTYVLPMMVNTKEQATNQQQQQRQQQRYLKGGIIEADVIDKIPTTASTTAKNDAVQGVHPILQKPWNKLQNWLQQNNPLGLLSRPRPRLLLSRHKITSLVMAAFIMLSVILTPLSEAFAAPSGGRMGGSFGGSSSRSSGTSSSRSYSSPRSSYSRGFSRGYSSGYFLRPSVTVAPSPYYYGYGPGGGGGVTVIRRGPSVADVFVYGVMAMAIYSAVTSSGNDTDVDSDGGAVTSVLGPGVSVAQISVALNVPDKDDPSSVVSFLNRLSRTARTDSRVGVANLVSQVALELLRQRRSTFAASSNYNHYRDANKANRDFSSLAIRERSKFEREDVSNYGGVEYGIKAGSSDRKLIGSSDSFSPKATAAVVTIILSIDGDSTKLPTINSIADLERGLTQIASDVKVDGCLRSAEVLWTPQAVGDTLSERDVIVDYPDLRSI